MQVIQFDQSKLYSQDPNKFNDFGRFSNAAGDFVFIPHGWFDDEEILKKFRGKKIIYIEFDEPNRFFMRGRRNFLCNTHDESRQSYHRILTICPYTAAWLNSIHKDSKSVPVFQPFNENLIPGNAEKKYDVLYAGHIVSKEIREIVESMSKFNYRFISNSDHHMVTDKGISYREKIRLVSETRITVVHNLLFPTFDHIQSVWNTPNYSENEAFKFVPPKISALVPKILGRFLFDRKKIEIPQVKQRLFEAAFCRSLILCRKDSFNIIEAFFEPGKQFVYYEKGKLSEKINQILLDFGRFESVIENAYERATNEYTTQKFFEKYLKNIA